MNITFIKMVTEYQVGSIWPFICGFYVAALVAAKRFDLAEEKLIALTQAMKLSTDSSLLFGSNEWIKAQTGMPMGQNWQTWSAAMYLYAARCVEEGSTPFFEEMRGE
jgi:glycogen debranching enzyme